MYGRFLDSPIKYLKGVGPAREKQLKAELNISTFEDLLYYFPYRYIDRSKFYRIADIHPEMPYVLLKGKLRQMQTVGSGRAMRLTAQLIDDSGTIELVWFRGIKWVKENLKANTDYVVFGRPTLFNRKYNIAHPDMDELEQLKKNHLKMNLQPFYSSTEKLRKGNLDGKGFVKMLRNLVDIIPKQIPEILSKEIIEKYDLVSREDALRMIHFPHSSKEILLAQKRLKFEELFFIQLHLLKSKLIRAYKNRGVVFKEVGKNFNEFYHQHLPFQLTNAQKKVIKEIRKDVGSGYQMNRLLQGDVGSGKTLVALMSMFLAIDNGFQACMMAPTEILANQHFEGISEFLKEMDVQLGLLTGSTKKKDRKVLHESLRNGELQILIGTHALIEETVQFNNLGMVVIDEQHRFGVHQRLALREKGAREGYLPHQLIMTATPIPRSLAMTAYADLDYSVIDELPPGRTPVKTVVIPESRRDEVIQRVQKACEQGKQTYWVCTLVEESEALQCQAAEDTAELLQRTLAKVTVGLVHGRMKAKEKERVMAAFKQGDIDLLVATTVIEVGVDVPNASLMIIENAERLGLAQLHQLRGRVGRGSNEGYCYLYTNHNASDRLEEFVNTTSGFEIANLDLKFRKSGDLLKGTSQSGTQFRFVNIGEDEEIVRRVKGDLDF